MAYKCGNPNHLHPLESHPPSIIWNSNTWRPKKASEITPWLPSTVPFKGLRPVKKIYVHFDDSKELMEIQRKIRMQLAIGRGIRKETIVLKLKPSHFSGELLVSGRVMVVCCNRTILSREYNKIHAKKSMFKSRKIHQNSCILCFSELFHTNPSASGTFVPSWNSECVFFP